MFLSNPQDCLLLTVDGGTVDFLVAYDDTDATRLDSAATPGRHARSLTAATTGALVTGVGNSATTQGHALSPNTTRRVRYLSIYFRLTNTGPVTATLNYSNDKGTTLFQQMAATCQPGDSLLYEEGEGWKYTPNPARTPSMNSMLANLVTEQRIANAIAAAATAFGGDPAALRLDPDYQPT